MKTEKEWFKFNWIKPSLDWYSSEPIVLKWNTYTYYKIERRFGPSWWLYGINFVEDPKYHGEETELGQISDLDLKKFIEWCKRENGGSKMINISAISGDFDIVEEIRRLYK